MISNKHLKCKCVHVCCKYSGIDNNNMCLKINIYSMYVI